MALQCTSSRFNAKRLALLFAISSIIFVSLSIFRSTELDAKSKKVLLPKEMKIWWTDVLLEIKQNHPEHRSLRYEESEGKYVHMGSRNVGKGVPGMKKIQNGPEGRGGRDFRKEGGRAGGRGRGMGSGFRPLIGSPNQPKKPVDPKTSSDFKATLKPERISLSGLRISNDLSPYTTLYQNMPIDDPVEMEIHLCFAAFLRDFAALKFLLYDVGMSAGSRNVMGGNALHCLACFYMNSEKTRIVDMTSKRQVTKSINDSPTKVTWLRDYLEKFHFKNTKIFSILAREALEGSNEDEVVETARWLLRAGADVNAKDLDGFSPLVIAGKGGISGLVKILLENKADPSITNKDLRTPLHYALIFGHTETASLLYKATGDNGLQAVDIFGVKPIELLENPGAISPEDTLKYFSIKQRKPKQIKRIIHPENYPNASSGWFAGSGGWGTERLKGFEDEMQCASIDQYWANEISAEDLYRKYIARNHPVLIRGLINDWNVIKMYQYEQLKKDFGNMEVTVSDVPYTAKFGGDTQVTMPLEDYLYQMKSHRIAGGKYPWYIFKGYNILKGMADDLDSPVRIEDCPTPPIIEKAFDSFLQVDGRSTKGHEGRQKFAAAQWAVGGEGTGAPVHYHNIAWNAVIYGAKKWLLYPPHNRIISNKQILEYYQNEMGPMALKGAIPQTCVQMAGDVLIVPESWAHGVLNIQQSIAIATELYAPSWKDGVYGAIFSNHQLVR